MRHRRLWRCYSGRRYGVEAVILMPLGGKTRDAFEDNQSMRFLAFLGVSRRLDLVSPGIDERAVFQRLRE